MTSTDEELILKYQQGNHEAYQMLFARYKKPVFNFCYRFLDNRADAEDTTAEVFLVLVKNKYAYQSNAKFSTWLYSIARNRCIDQLRKRRNFFSLWVRNPSTGAEEMIDIPDHSNLPDKNVASADVSLNIQKAINKLPENQKQALILREYQQLNYQEISVILGTSLQNVKILIFRARERLRTELSSFLKEDYQ